MYRVIQAMLRVVTTIRLKFSLNLGLYAVQQLSLDIDPCSKKLIGLQTL